MLSKEEHHNIKKRLLGYIQPERISSFPDQISALAWLIQNVLPSSLLLSRARYSEDSLIQAVGEGVQQYVILGAGMDTFAFRRPELLKQLHVYEVDHPATQAYKIRRLAKLGWNIPEQLHFVPVDFTHDNLASTLTNSSYNHQVKSFFSWLGVTYYLPRDTVLATLSTIAGIAPEGSIVVFDYYNEDVFIPEKATKSMQVGMEKLQRIGEPLITGFDPSMMSTDLAAQGFRLIDNLSPSDIEKQYFHKRSDNYHAWKHAYFACAVVE